MEKYRGLYTWREGQSHMIIAHHMTVHQSCVWGIHMPSVMHMTSGSCADGQDCLALHQTYLILSNIIYCYLILSTWILSCDQHQIDG